MGLTAFGLVYLPLLVAVAVFARQWLPALVIFSTCIQAASVFNVPVGDGAFGISPYNVTALAAFCVLLLHLWQQRRQPIAEYKYPKAAFWLLVGYAVVAVIGALTLPWLFEGLPVNLLDDPDRSAWRRLLPLTFSLANLVQAVNLCIHAVVLVYLLQSAQRQDWQPSGPILGLTAALALVLVLGLYERLAQSFDWPSSIAFWASNPGYRQEHESIMMGILRIAVPFSEPSYLSVLLAATTVGFLAMVAFGKHRLWAFAGTLLCGLGLLNTFGSTGWAAVGLGLAGMLLWLIWRAWHTPRLRNLALLFWTTTALIAGAVTYVALYTPAKPTAMEAVDRMVISKLDESNVRKKSNEQALNIIQETRGLGVGLGSHRASSFLASLFSNTGILGGALFLAMLGALWRGYARARSLTDVQLFTAFALATATLGTTLGIPDLTLPMFWAFIFLAFLYHPEEKGFRFPVSGFRFQENRKPETRRSRATP